jgi:site-specific recombinase XerD
MRSSHLCPFLPLPHLAWSLGLMFLSGPHTLHICFATHLLEGGYDIGPV